VRVKSRLLPRRSPSRSVTLLITIYLNGEAREVPEGLTLAELLDWLKFPSDRVAVELNSEIVPKARWPETPVRSEDRLEVVHFVGGGWGGCRRGGREVPASGSGVRPRRILSI